MKNNYYNELPESFCYRFKYEVWPFNRFLNHLYFLGIPVYTLFSLHISLKWPIVKISKWEIIAMYLAISSFWFWKYLILTYNKKVLNPFIKELSTKNNSSEVVDIINKFDNFSEKRIKWIVLVISLVIVMVPYYWSSSYVIQIGFYDKFDIWYILTYPFVIALVICGSYGVLYIIKTFGIIIAVFKYFPIEIDYYNPDKLSGLSLYYKFINKTGHMMWCGLLCVPILIFDAQYQWALEPKRWAIIWCMVIIYAFVNFATYFVPTFLIYIKARKIKMILLNYYYEEVKKLENIWRNIPFKEYQITRDNYLILRDCSIMPNITNFIAGPLYLFIVRIAIEFLLKK
jgi:hypothetical protein